MAWWEWLVFGCVCVPLAVSGVVCAAAAVWELLSGLWDLL